MTDRRKEFLKLEEIFEHQVFELHMGQDRNAYIPYMMNDALECYLELKNCRLTGTYLPELTEKMFYSVTEHEEGYAMIVHQAEENVFTLWFDDIEEHLHCYQYHRIGHFWIKGGEQWRQLVYIIGTIYDKYQYLGEAVCNQQELELLPLMEAAPFRAWSPIKESLDSMYPDTRQGLQLLHRMAVQSGSRNLAGMIKLYERMPFDFLSHRITRYLQKKQGEKLYRFILDKIIQSSEPYETRSYGEKLNKEICIRRKEIAERLKVQGFIGRYPFFEKDNVKITAAEEHPFTILEAEDFHFRIQFMVSEGRSCKGINSGFFKGFGRTGRIESSLDFLE